MACCTFGKVIFLLGGGGGGEDVKVYMEGYVDLISLYM